jgi:chemotaxis protein methyltransferase CheR
MASPPRLWKTEISPMLSDLSYQHLRFEGRPRPLGVSSDGPPGLTTAPRRPSLRPRREESQLSADEQAVVAAALASAGLAPSGYRSGPIRRRLPAVLRAVRSATPTAGAARIAADARLAERAINTLLIGHSEPFRDAAVFADLRERVLPELARDRWGLNVWSVGCSHGVELMSIALLLAERGVAAGSRLRGSDCRPMAIEQARVAAVTGVAACVGDRLPHLAPWLESPGFITAANRIEWVVEDALAGASRPVPGPVACANPSPAWDLVLCRNMAIYFDSDAAAQLWQRLVVSLAPGGILVTGKAETPSANLPLTRLAKCIYRRNEAPA